MPLGLRLRRRRTDTNGGRSMTRVVLAMMKHETNTFSPVPTDLARFAKGAERPIEGEAVLAAYRGTGSCMAGFIDVAEAGGKADIVPSIAANAPPSGPVQNAAYEYICDAILESVAGGCDAILLDPPRRDGDRAARGRRGRAARAHPGDRAGRPDRGDPGHARQPLPRAGGARGRHRRLPEPTPTSTTTRRGCGLRDRSSRCCGAR